jgi:ssDNA-binding Zn-finger/Zn-ribbon topoisomerase 1
MLKIINYRCPKCLYEEEELLNVDREFFKTKKFCPQCKTELVEFNFKNNTQRVYICDPQH